MGDSNNRRLEQVVRPLIKRLSDKEILENFRNLVKYPFNECDGLLLRAYCEELVARSLLTAR